MKTRSDLGIRVLLDTNYLVGWHRETDPQHPRASHVQEVLRDVKSIRHVLDCVYSELIAVLARSYAEEDQLGDFMSVADKLKKEYWPRLVWFAYVGGGSLLKRAIDVCKEAAETSGVGISHHDAMLLLYAKEKGIRYIVSFDEDLRKVRTLEGEKLRVTVVNDKNREVLRGG